MSQNSASSSRRSRNGEPQRVFPSFLEAAAPGNFLQFCISLLECWFFSRDYARLGVGVPFLALLAFPVGIWFWIRSTTTITLLSHYEQVLQSAVDQKNLRLQETALLAMCGLQPADYDYRMRLGKFYNQNGRQDDAYQEVSSLAPEDREGSVDARLWIVQQALSDSPIRPLTTEQIEKQLLLIVKAQPNNLVAHEILAKEYLQRKEFLLAERHLAEAATGNPELGVELARLRIDLKRPQQEIDEATDNAITSLTKTLEKDPTDISSSSNLVRALVLKQEFEKARRSLLAVRTRFPDDVSLKMLQAELDLIGIEQQLQTSLLNRDAAVLQTYQVIQYDPTSVRALELLLGLKAIGAEISADKLTATAEYWKTAAGREPGELNAAIMLARVYLLAGDASAAVEAIRPLAEKKPEVQLGFAELLLKSGAAAEGEVLLKQIVDRVDKNRQEHPEVPENWMLQSDALILLKRPEAVRDLVKSYVPSQSQNLTVMNQRMLDLNGRACLLMFDAMTGYNSAIIPIMRTRDEIVLQDAPPEQVLELLQDALKSPLTAPASLERLCLLSLSHHRAAREAADTVMKLRTQGQVGLVAMNLLSSFFIALQEYKNAILLLEQSSVISRGRDPMVLNNLAVALIRGEPEEKERALGQVNQALAIVPENSDVLTTRGEIYVAMERWDDALKDLTHALELRDSNFETHLLLERTYRALRDTEKADHHQKRAAEIQTKAAVTPH